MLFVGVHLCLNLGFDGSEFLNEHLFNRYVGKILFFLNNKSSFSVCLLLKVLSLGSDVDKPFCQFQLLFGVQYFVSSVSLTYLVIFFQFQWQTMRSSEGLYSKPPWPQRVSGKELSIVSLRFFGWGVFFFVIPYVRLEFLLICLSGHSVSKCHCLIHCWLNMRWKFVLVHKNTEKVLYMYEANV